MFACILEGNWPLSEWLDGHHVNDGNAIANSESTHAKLSPRCRFMHVWNILLLPQYNAKSWRRAGVIEETLSNYQRTAQYEVSYKCAVYSSGELGINRRDERCIDVESDFAL